MGFYKEFAKEHDLLATWRERTPKHKAFFKKILGSKPLKVLDCACGTGFHIWLLSKLGHKVTGSDSSPAMLSEAKKNLSKRKAKASLHKLDFRKVGKKFGKGKFDAVVCMGNSLPHMLSEKETLKALKAFHKVLKKNGTLALSIRNYDQLEKEQTRFFVRPGVKGNLYLYVLDHFDKTLDFNVLRIKPKTGELKVFKTTSFKLKQGLLTKLLRKAGFKQIKFFEKNKQVKPGKAKTEFVKITAAKIS